MKNILIVIAILFTLPLASQEAHRQNDVQIINNGLKITAEKRRHEGMQFGWSVDVSGKYVFVGTPFYSNKRYQNLGLVKIFKLGNDSFKSIWSIVPHILETDMSFGKHVKYVKGSMVVSSTGRNYSVSPNSKTKLHGTITKSTPIKFLYSGKLNTKKITCRDAKENIRFGDEIELSEKYLVSSAIFLKNKNKSEGAVYVYTIEGDNIPFLLKIIPPKNTKQFGHSIALSGNDLIISAKDEIFFYIIKNSTAILCDRFKKTNAENFGESVAITNDYAFIANPSKTPNFFGMEIPKTDSIFSYVIMQDDGSMKRELVPNIASEKAKHDVSNRVFSERAKPVYDSITAYQKLSNSEEVLVYKKLKNNNWKYHQTLHSNRPTPYEFFGNSMDAKGDLCVVGAFSSPITYEFNNMNAYAGAAFVYRLNDKGYWKLTTKLLPEKRHYWTKFGFSVATDGKGVVVGSRFEKTDKNGKTPINEAGAVYYYDFNKQ
jgi:hypothetical protein